MGITERERRGRVVLLTSWSVEQRAPCSALGLSVWPTKNLHCVASSVTSNPMLESPRHGYAEPLTVTSGLRQRRRPCRGCSKSSAQLDSQTLRNVVFQARLVFLDGRLSRGEILFARLLSRPGRWREIDVREILRL